MQGIKQKKIISDILAKLKSLQRYEASVGGGCDCCGTWATHDECDYGDWVRFEDIEELINDLQNENIGE